MPKYKDTLQKTKITERLKEKILIFLKYHLILLFDIIIFLFSECNSQRVANVTR